MEGEPIQEMSAIEMSCKTHEIVDVFHGYAHTEEADTFSRQHIHGLNPSFYGRDGFPSEESLIAMFKLWIHQKCHNYILVANDPKKEAKALGLTIFDFKLVPWAERNHKASHEIALRFKELSVSIRGRSCSQSAHSYFVSAPYSPNALSSMAKARHGFHCAFYDAVELYYEWLMF
jgi:hypothetical protein